MRVAHVSEVSWGGVVSLLHAFMAEQVRRGHEVSLLAPAAFPPGPAAVPYTPWDLDRRRPATYPRAISQLRGQLRAQQPDVVHLHSAFAGFFGRLPVLSATGGLPVVFQPHAWSFDLFDNPRAGSAMRGWERIAARRTDLLVGNCQDELDEGRSFGVLTPSQVIGVPVDHDHFDLVGETVRAEARQRLGVTRPKMLLCLGRLARQKGQDQLVAAWEAAPLPDTELVLVGPGDDTALRELAPTQWGTSIRAVGSTDDVRPWLWACDLLVLPSRYETVAVVVAEAMAVARPVVATRVNGAAMAVTDGPLDAAGAVVAVGDMPALLEQCRLRLADAELYEREALAARKRAVELFEITLIGDRLDTAYARAQQVAQQTTRTANGGAA